jgi:hypothetical protein
MVASVGGWREKSERAQKNNDQGFPPRKAKRGVRAEIIGEGCTRAASSTGGRAKSNFLFFLSIKSSPRRPSDAATRRSLKGCRTGHIDNTTLVGRTLPLSVKSLKSRQSMPAEIKTKPQPLKWMVVLIPGANRRLPPPLAPLSSDHLIQLADITQPPKVPACLVASNT